MRRTLPRTRISQLEDEQLYGPRRRGVTTAVVAGTGVPFGGNHNDLSGLQGGTAGPPGEFYHFTNDHHNALAATIGATGFDAYRTTLYGTQVYLTHASIAAYLTGRLDFLGNDGLVSNMATYLDSGAGTRVFLRINATDIVSLCNRAANGVVQVRANTATAGSGGEKVAAQFEDDKITFYSGGTAHLEITSGGAGVVVFTVP